MQKYGFLKSGKNGFIKRFYRNLRKSVKQRYFASQLREFCRK